MPNRGPYHLDPWTDIVEIHFPTIPDYLAISLQPLHAIAKGSNATWQCAFGHNTIGTFEEPALAGDFIRIDTEDDIAEWSEANFGAGVTTFSSVPGFNVPPDRVAYSFSGLYTGQSPPPYQHVAFSYAKEIEVKGLYTINATFSASGDVNADFGYEEEVAPGSTKVVWKTTGKARYTGVLPGRAWTFETFEFDAWEWGTYPWTGATGTEAWGNFGHPAPGAAPTNEFWEDSFAHYQWHKLVWKDGDTGGTEVNAPNAAEGAYVKSGAPEWQLRGVPLAGHFCYAWGAFSSSVVGGWDGYDHPEMIVGNNAGWEEMGTGNYPAEALTLWLKQGDTDREYEYFGHYAPQHSTTLTLVFKLKPIEPPGGGG